MKLGFIGNGIVGGATRKTLENGLHDIKIYDPPQGYMDDMSDREVIFISVPVPTRPDGIQDLTILRNSVDRCPTSAFIFVRSSVLPGTCDSLRGTITSTVGWGSAGGGLGASDFSWTINPAPSFALGFKFPKLFSVPEFLTERTAAADAERLDIVAPGGAVEILKALFPQKNIIQVGSNSEAEMVKYVHNCFCAVKVNFFNLIYQMCAGKGLAYGRVIDAACDITGFIEKTHTKVPGPDAQFGFGGKCFPKDLYAFTKFVESEKGSTFLRAVVQENFLNRFGGLF
jgi:UDP-glucose 6-dehydrogenase